MQVPSGLWLVLAVGMMLRIIRRGRGLDYAMAGFFSALATATHYQAAVVVFGILAAHLEARRRENRPLLTALADARIYIAGFVTVLTFVCATPDAVLDPSQTARGYELARAFTGQAGTCGWWYLLFRVMPDTLGIGLLIFLLLALVWVILRPRLGTLALLALTAGNFVSLTVGHTALMYRYAINPLLVMALFGGTFAADLIALASNWLGNRYGISLAVGLAGLLLAPSLISDLQLNRLLSQSDTRTQARLWIEKHIPLEKRILQLRIAKHIALEKYTVQLTLIAATDYDPLWNSFGKPQLPGSYQLIPMEDFGSLRANGILWVLSDSLPGLVRYSPGPSDAEQKGLNSEARLVLDINPIKGGAPMPVFDPNDAFYVPYQHISSMRWPGPRIRIWRLNHIE